MAKNRRVKPAEPAILKIENWQGADELIKRIANLQFTISQAEAAAADQINKLKKTLADEVVSYQESIKLYHRSLEAFAMEHLADFEPKQSKQLNFGKLGWRKSTVIHITKKTLELLKKVFGSKVKKFIRIKEEPDKEAMDKLTDEELVRVGARRKSKEVFFVEPDLLEAVDYAN